MLPLDDAGRATPAANPRNFNSGLAPSGVPAASHPLPLVPQAPTPKRLQGETGLPDGVSGPLGYVCTPGGSAGTGRSLMHSGSASPHDAEVKRNRSSFALSVWGCSCEDQIASVSVCLCVSVRICQ